MSKTELMLHQESIENGSKSFAMASFFFSKLQKEAAWKLYSWCRNCDDQIDDATVAEAPLRLLALRTATTAMMIDSIPASFHFRGMQDVLRNYQIPLKYPLDLLRGMEMDVQGRRFATLVELEEYCYCVAGVVGLMMCHIMGVRDDQALKHAVALGNAMQLTNICRDIVEDRGRGRLYIPTSWLQEMGLTESDLFLEKNEACLIALQERLLKRADALYSEGYQGLRYLSLRSSWAVLIAAKVYSHIGVLIRKNPVVSLRQRVYVSRWKKVGLVLSSLKSFIPQVWWCMRGRSAIRAPQRVWSSL